MKLIFSAATLLLVSMTVGCSPKASAASQAPKLAPITYEDYDHGNFVDCDLTDGRKLVATPALVYIGSDVLSKTAVGKTEGESVSQILYKKGDERITAYKDNGHEGIIVKNKATGEVKDLQCADEKLSL